MIRLGLLGHRGRMGQTVSRLIETEFKNTAILAATADQGESQESLLKVDAVIDFSAPAAMTLLTDRAILAAKKGAPLPAFVVGSTGWTSSEKTVVEALAERATVLMSSNFSTGVLALTEIMRTAAPLLRKLGYRAVMVDTHHCHKKDAPSGTALAIQRVVEEAQGGPIEILSIRAGEVIGEHETTFYGQADRITIGHYAQDRSIFARGAIEAALWLAREKPHGRAGKVLGMDAFLEHLKKSAGIEGV